MTVQFYSKDFATRVCDFLSSNHGDCLRHDEYALPTYRVLKVKNKNLWRIRITRYIYGPYNSSSWLTIYDFQAIKDHVVSL